MCDQINIFHKKTVYWKDENKEKRGRARPIFKKTWATGQSTLPRMAGVQFNLEKYYFYWPAYFAGR